MGKNRRRIKKKWKKFYRPSEAVRIYQDYMLAIVNFKIIDRMPKNIHDSSLVHRVRLGRRVPPLNLVERQS